MDSKETQNLLRIIDDRVNKILNNSKYSKIYTGVVTGTDVYEEGNMYWVNARILGEDTIFTFPNQTGKPLNVGDSVYIQTIGGDLNTGIITQRIVSHNNDEVSGFYPVGSIYMSLNDTDPRYIFGGMWERLEAGRFLISADIASTTSTYIAGNTGGEATHLLTVDEIPSHFHTSYGWAAVADGSGDYVTFGATDNPTTQSKNTRTTGGSQPHNNIPPYLVVYMWKRVR